MRPALAIKCTLGFLIAFSAVYWGSASESLIYPAAFLLGAGLGFMPDRWFWR